jgi:ParB/RepB/Spo0J family partition protein
MDKHMDNEVYHIQLDPSKIKIKQNIRRVDTSTPQFEALKQDIKTNGLLQNVVVFEDNKEFILHMGHRRFEAIKELNDEGNKMKVNASVRPMPNGDYTRLQISENLLRQDLSLYEEVMAFKSMINKDSTVKSIQEDFGHSYSYVQKRLQLSNLCKEVLNPVYFSSREFEVSRYLLVSTTPQKTQQKAIDSVRGKLSRKEYLDGFYDGTNYNNWTASPLLTFNKPKKETIIHICGNEDNLKKYSKEFGHKLQPSLKLFKEVSNDYPSCDKFVDHVLIHHYPEIKKAVDKLTVHKNLESWTEHCIRINSYADFVAKFMMVEQKANSDKDYKNPITSWTGKKGKWGIVYQCKPKAKAKKSTSSIERSKYYLQTKKFAKATLTKYWSELFVHVTHGGIKPKDQDKLFIQASKNMDLKDIAKQDHVSGLNLKKIMLAFGKESLINTDLKPKDNNYKSVWTVIGEQVMYGFLFEYMTQCSINELNKIAKMTGFDSYKERVLQHIEAKPKTQDDKELGEYRKSVYECFSTANLQNKLKSKCKKADLVRDAVAMTSLNGSFLFKDIFTSIEANWKVFNALTYMDKVKHYNSLLGGASTS